MKFLLLLLMTSSLWGASTLDIEEAKQSIKTLMAPLIPGTPRKMPPTLKNFRVDQCEKYVINWSDMLLLKSSVTLNYKFKEGCDIQGMVTPEILSPFQVSLSLRNLNSYNKMESENKITASLESRPIMFLEVRKGTLTGKKGEVKFEADYQIQVNPISDTEPVEKDLGGELRIIEIYGSKTKIKEKIKVR